MIAVSATRAWGTATLTVVAAFAAAISGCGSGGEPSSTAAGKPGATERKPSAAGKPRKWEDSDLFIEINGTDGDAGLHMELVGDGWRRFSLTAPDGAAVMTLDARGSLGSQGLTSIASESSEPSFAEFPLARFKQRFPEGRYQFTGETLDGKTLRGTDRLTHDLPKAPNVRTPRDGDRVDPGGFRFRWKPVTEPAGIEIVRYELTVSNDDAPHGELVIEQNGRATSAGIPGEYLDPNTNYLAELIAKERSGNQTITAVEFKTGR